MLTQSIIFPAVLAAALAPPAENPVFETLISEGIKVENRSHTLPAPTMADGLTAPRQREIIERVSAGRGWKQMTRKSVVAPHIFRLGRIDGTNVRSADFYFVAYGDLDKMTDKKFLKELLGADRQKPEDAEGKVIEANDLAARKIEILAANKEHEGYAYGSFDLIKKVRLSAAVRSFYSRTSDSVTTAAMLDPRFAGDKDFPNQWQPLSSEGGGKFSTGKAEAYEGAGVYMKVTQLAEPAGAIFIECHILFDEPHGWFDGANLLGSKLPAVVQNQVREARRNLLKSAEKNDP